MQGPRQSACCHVVCVILGFGIPWTIRLTCVRVEGVAAEWVGISRIGVWDVVGAFCSTLIVDYLLTVVSDMHWFSTAETCELLSKFDNIYLWGDSQTRHLTQAFAVLLREDLIDGGRATWREDVEEDPGCHCHMLFRASDCAFWSATSIQSVLDGDPASIKCPADKRPALIDSK